METDELADVLRWTQTVIELADGDPTKGNLVIGSPLAVAMAARAFGRWGFGTCGLKEDFAEAVAIARGVDPLSHSIVIGYKYTPAIPAGVLVADDDVVSDISEALRIVERTGDDFGLALVHSRSDWPCCTAVRPSARGLTFSSRSGELSAKGRYTGRSCLSAISHRPGAGRGRRSRRGDHDHEDSAGRSVRSRRGRVVQSGHPDSGGDVARKEPRTTCGRPRRRSTGWAGPLYAGLAMRQVTALRLRALAGARAWRRGGIPPFAGSLPRDGHLVWLRRAHGDGCGDGVAADNRQGLVARNGLRGNRLSQPVSRLARGERDVIGALEAFGTL